MSQNAVPRSTELIDTKSYSPILSHTRPPLSYGFYGIVEAEDPNDDGFGLCETDEGKASIMIAVSFVHLVINMIFVGSYAFVTMFQVHVSP